MIVKALGAIFIIGSCTMFGYTIKFRHRCRINNLENFNSCLGIIRHEVCFALNDVIRAIKKAEEYADFQNKIIFERFINTAGVADGETMSEIWTRCIDTCKNEIIYDKSDTDVIREFGNLLGSGDISTQQENIINIENKLIEQIKLCNIKNEKYDVTSKLGIYVGIVIVILLI